MRFDLISVWLADAIVEHKAEADWSKILSTGIGIASIAMGAIEGYKRIRAASLGISLLKVASSVVEAGHTRGMSWASWVGSSRSGTA